MKYAFVGAITRTGVKGEKRAIRDTVNTLPSLSQRNSEWWAILSTIPLCTILHCSSPNAFITTNKSNNDLFLERLHKKRDNFFTTKTRICKNANSCLDQRDRSRLRTNSVDRCRTMAQKNFSARKGTTRNQQLLEDSTRKERASAKYE